MLATMTIIGLAGLAMLLSATTVSAGRGESKCACVCERVGWWSSIFYAAMLVGLIGTALTGVVAFVFWGGPMSGWLLMLHCSAAPLFAMGIAGMALTWAERNRFGPTGGTFNGAQKALFWLILLTGVVVILAAVVPMMGWPGTHGQHVLYITHRYSSIVLLVLVAVHGLTVLRAR